MAAWGLQADECASELGRVSVEYTQLLFYSSYFVGLVADGRSDATAAADALLSLP